VKRLRAKKILAIAAGPTRLLVAELTAHSPPAEQLRAFEFVYPEDASFDAPATLGKLLQAELKRRGCTGRDAVIGLPAAWLTTRSRQLPPLAPDLVPSTLRLFAESEFGTQYEGLVLDYTGSPTPAAPSTVLVVGVMRSRLDQVRQMAQAAGLRLGGVTATAAAVSLLAVRARETQASLLVASPLGVELLTQQSGELVQLRHLSSSPAADVAALAADLRRVFAAGGGAELAVSGLSAGDRQDLVSRLNIAPRELPPQRLVPNLVFSEEVAPAVALAAAVQSDNTLPDFLSSRLAVTPATMSRRPLFWSGAVAAVLLLLSALGWAHHRSLQNEVASIEASLAEMAPQIEQVELADGRRRTVQNFSGGAPRYLSCLADLTRAFPDDGSVWLVSFSLRQNLSGQMSGKATGEHQVLSLLDRLTGSQRFADLKLVEVREAGRGSREVTFAIAFSWKQGELKP
jgi:hypothetical protein